MPSAKQKGVRTILILAANPKGTTHLRLDEELRRIKDSLKQSSGRDKFNVQLETAVTIGHIRRALLDTQPEIVHFCGHGAGIDGIACEDDLGQLKLIPTSALANLFKLVENHVRCVVLNACFAEVQSNEVVRHIECVVGMKHSIGDEAALKFAEGFYDALFSGKEFIDCYKWGVNALRLENIPEDATPVIRMKESTKGSIASRPNASKTRPKTSPIEVENCSLKPVPSVRPQKMNLLLALSLLIALVAWATWGIKADPAYQPLAGSYTQETYDDPYIDVETGFRLEAVNTSLSVSVDPLTGKLSTVEITTVQVSYIAMDNKVITTYAAEWRYKEVERTGPTFVKLEGSPRARFAFDEFTLHGIMTDEVANKFDLFKQKINRKFQTAKAELVLNDNRQLQKRVTYNGGELKTYTYIRN